MQIESFQAFLEEFIKFVGHKTVVRLITDGAAAHRSTRLKMVEQLTLEHLPSLVAGVESGRAIIQRTASRLKESSF